MNWSAVGRVLVWLLVGCGVLLAPLPYVDAGGPLPTVQAVLPVVGLFGLAVAALALLVRARLAAALAVVAALALLAPALPLAPRPDTPAAGGDLRVVTLNTEFGQADPTGVVKAVHTRDADVLVLLEATPAHWAALKAHGLRSLLPHATGTVHGSAAGTVVATREPVTCPDPATACGRVVTATRAADEPFSQVDVRLPDGTVVRGAHPFPPVGQGERSWRLSLGRLDRWIHQVHAGERIVVTGDFNAGPVHPAFRRIADGLVQAPRAWPWQPTWPQESGVPPFVQIDHVLARGFAVAEEGTFLVPGTDHAGVSATLRPR
ncbi:endonuclease/exonuclease/phosphatase family protein [Mobilicoccus massiliensis]|uniref:endonuclease/exonuclease/phosphatase family protein n=1 Tax=Mobilicoccus massiliensis TaxID=1522310 RepID=UPI00058F18F5|nr:endonuclease/exonuclease/phosphatase family protein [Mobilicoccus massiliensis]